MRIGCAVLHLTKHEQLVLTLVILLLLTGLAVKAYRTSHPAAAPRGAAEAKLHATD